MKIISILAIGIGAAILVPSLLLSAVAFSDAYYRCPGEQCSDAVTAGTFGALAATAALVLIGSGSIHLWHRRS